MQVAGKILSLEKQVDHLDLSIRALGQELWDVRAGPGWDTCFGLGLSPISGSSCHSPRMQTLREKICHTLINQQKVEEKRSRLSALRRMIVMDSMSACAQWGAQVDGGVIVACRQAQAKWELLGKTIGSPA
ncbi:hypothetical protein ACLOJK_036908 [Asimina triloba]